MTITATQRAYSGAFTVASNTCASNVATITPTTSSSTFTVTAQGANNPAGQYCTITFNGGNGMTGQLQVGVTVTGGSISVKGR
jgi:hypothetical protein